MDTVNQSRREKEREKERIRKERKKEQKQNREAQAAEAIGDWGSMERAV